MRFIALLCVVGTLAAGSAQAQEVPYTDLTKTTCKDFVALPDLPVGLILHFADGYMNARGGKPPVYDPTGMEAIGGKFGTFCANNPDAPVMAAVEFAWK